MYNDAPALVKRLKKIFSEEDLDLICKDYMLAVQRGAALEVGVVRQEGASFTPRPARILAILTEDGEVKNLLAIRAALWSCMSEREVPDDNELSNLVFEVRYLIDNMPISCKVVASTEVVIVIVASIALDWVRHLHMCRDLSAAAKEQILNGISKQVIENGLMKEDRPQLFLKLKQAVRQQRLLY